jgi:hypothetical protein
MQQFVSQFIDFDGSPALANKALPHLGLSQMIKWLKPIDRLARAT